MEQHTRRRHRYDGGGLIIGGILLVVGVYYLLSETLGYNLPEIDWDKMWPLILIVVGGLIVYGAWTRTHEG